MTHAFLLTARYADGRERSTRHRTLTSAIDRVANQTAAGKTIETADVREGGSILGRYTRHEGWKGAR